jgi:hypothetical protein
MTLSTFFVFLMLSPALAAELACIDEAKGELMGVCVD